MTTIAPVHWVQTEHPRTAYISSDMPMEKYSASFPLTPTVQCSGVAGKVQPSSREEGGHAYIVADDGLKWRVTWSTDDVTCESCKELAAIYILKNHFRSRQRSILR